MAFLEITSPHSNHSLQWDEREALRLSGEILPFVSEVAPAERIAALAYHIAAAIVELDAPVHPCIDAVMADLAGCVVEELCKASFRAKRKREATESGTSGSGTYAAVACGK